MFNDDYTDTDMASGGSPGAPATNRPDGSGRRIGIVAARWHADIVEAMVKGAQQELEACGVAADNITIEHCPGTFEIPVVASRMAHRHDFDAVICLGVVIRGETAHFEYVAGPVAYGIQNIAIKTQTPCLFGVLTTETEEQAWDRAGGKHGNKGAEAAAAALETIDTLQRLSTP